MDYAIELNNISKTYKVYNNPKNRLFELLSIGSEHFSEHHVLKNVDLKIPKAQTIGIIGQNGSGKSTILQIICGILKPTSGNVFVDGKISALLELGAGFNPEFTGIENVYMNGAIQGFSKEEMDLRFPAIEKFAEIGDYIYQPVKTYSSGMYVRLAFAAAINVDPDILIVDEALAVGDLYFQLKCIEKIKDFKQKGKTILYVTHDTYSVKNICDYAIWIHEGNINLQGNPIYVVNEYEDFMKQKNGDLPVENPSFNEVEKKDYLSIKNVNFLSYHSENNVQQQFEVNSGMTVSISYEVYKEIDDIVIGLAIFSANGDYICGLNTKLDGYKVKTQLGVNVMHLHYHNLNLLPGTYFVDVGIFENSAIARLDYKSRIGSFNVISKSYVAEGLVLLDHSWEVIL